ncbi:MAG: glycosyltransferase family 4 protein [Cyanomargarita calcarea GSE-NOS-MK-12-04C]|jgi:glycosyltransferase involved in cell wall biosynthesis|uniref:Glycosyltransferase family 4 protein n=1 Tax=Cyanomargarita calcarea GSE-NOS-MK-12-04C TaxID=2839659 RepID=A0A951UYB8_9CYAN|nr:glycosyltransferase family 4 protein [Cyanomargarita calcarea GSE-NOS-MK-12-04C]
MNQPNIVMVGASLKQNGGIATVENLILKNASSQILIQHIASHDEGSPIHRIKVFYQALTVFLLKLLSKKTDIIHIHLSDGGSTLRKAVIVLIALMFRKPVLMHAHGAEFDVKYSKFPKLAQQIMNGIFRRSEGFIVLSKTWKEYYVKNLGLNEKQVIILPNPTELPTKIPNRKDVNKVKLAFFGRVGDRKGTFDLIKAFANLPKNIQENSELIIAGDGDIEQGENLVKSLNISEKVTFLGWIDPQTRDALLATVDVFVLPSYNEGLPMALLEAMGWGLPAIVTPVGGIPELIIANKNGLLVTPGNIQQLSESMQLLIENENLRIEIGKQARKTVAPFDVKIYCDRLNDIYTQILQSEPDLIVAPGTQTITQ